MKQTFDLVICYNGRAGYAVTPFSDKGLAMETFDRAVKLREVVAACLYEPNGTLLKSYAAGKMPANY